MFIQSKVLRKSNRHKVMHILKAGLLPDGTIGAVAHSSSVDVRVPFKSPTRPVVRAAAWPSVNGETIMMNATYALRDTFSSYLWRLLPKGNIYTNY